MKTIFSASARQTRQFGARLARTLRKGSLIGFAGALGSGKTTLIQGIVAHLTGRQATSPSFVIVHEYDGPVPVYHFDLYRMKSPDEIQSIGWEEYLGRGIILVEWAERIADLLPAGAMLISLEPVGRNRRKITMRKVVRKPKTK